jgi:hypothetical protein
MRVGRGGDAENGQDRGGDRERKTSGRHGFSSERQQLYAKSPGVCREKLHFLNPVPIRMIHDRWIDKYTERRVSALLELKNDLEAKAWRQSQKPA